MSKLYLNVVEDNDDDDVQMLMMVISVTELHSIVLHDVAKPLCTH